MSGANEWCERIAAGVLEAAFSAPELRPPLEHEGKPWYLVLPHHSYRYPTPPEWKPERGLGKLQGDDRQDYPEAELLELLRREWTGNLNPALLFAMRRGADVIEGRAGRIAELEAENARLTELHKVACNSAIRAHGQLSVLAARSCDSDDAGVSELYLHRYHHIRSGDCLAHGFYERADGKSTCPKCDAQEPGQFDGEPTVSPLPLNALRHSR